MQSLPTFDLVLFGGTGDLAMRKLLPALYRRLLRRPDRRRRRASSASARSAADARGIPGSRCAAAARRTSAATSTPKKWPEFAEQLDYVRVDAQSDGDFAAARRSCSRTATAACACSSFRPARTCSRRSAEALATAVAGHAGFARRAGEAARATTAPRRRRSTSASARSSRVSRSFASITTSARRPCRT